MIIWFLQGKHQVKVSLFSCNIVLVFETFFLNKRCSGSSNQLVIPTRGDRKISARPRNELSF